MDEAGDRGAGSGGEEVWLTDWMEVGSGLVEQFADLTEDWNPIHVDEDAARASGLSGTIAHGFLLVSLLAPLLADSGHPLGDEPNLLNYGFDSLRFIAPVPTDSRIRAQFREVGRERVETGLRITLDVEIEVEGGERPAMVARWALLKRG